MIAELDYPVKSLKGKLGKQYYARVQYGKTVVSAAQNVTNHLLRHKNEPARPSQKITQGSIDVDLDVNFYLTKIRSRASYKNK